MLVQQFESGTMHGGRERRVALNSARRNVHERSQDRAAGQQGQGVDGRTPHPVVGLREQRPEVISHVGQLIVASAKCFAGLKTKIRSIIFDYDGAVAFDSEDL